jgi:hypothetical protein
MARKKTDARGNHWIEQAVVVKKSHPLVKNEKTAEAVAERHARKRAKKKAEDAKSYRFVARPKECFLAFRGQRRGDHVTVYWGKLKPQTGGRKTCQ